MKTRTGNKVKNKKNNIHNEKGWLALNGLANLYFLFLEKVITYIFTLYLLGEQPKEAKILF